MSYPNFYRLMLVTQKADIPLNDYLDHIEQCVKGGVTSVQLREKKADFASLVSFGQALMSLLQPYEVPLIINDDVSLAKQLNAQGVHLGQQDGCPIHARSYLGEKALIGLTTNTLDEVESSHNLPINYIGIGAIYPTGNKANITQIWSTEELKKATKISQHTCVAIGGINAHNIDDVLRCGVDGIAAIGALSDLSNSHSNTQQLINTILKY